MKIHILLLFALSVINGYAQEKFSKKELIVHFNSMYLTESQVKNELKKVSDTLHFKHIEVIGNIKERNSFLLKFENEVDVKSLIDSFMKTGLFRFVEPNYLGEGHGYMETTPNDSFFLTRQWSHLNNGTFSLSPSSLDADIDTDLAWDITQGNTNLIVAVLDSGLKLDHPEFLNRTVAGYDFVNNDTDPTDDHGHGTNVTGIALAKGNNSIGYAGVNWNSKIMTCKILDSNNSGYYSWWASAIYFAVDNGAKVLNMSVGGNSPSILLEEAINYAYNNNVSVVVSTGNQNSSIQYPAKYTNAFAVGSTNSNDVRSNPFFWSPTSGSNFGAELDFVAPGNYIYGLNHTSNTNYNTYWGGTSQAAPHVTGVISLMLSVNPDLTVNQIRQILQETSEDMVGDSFDTLGWDENYGFGRINAFNALSHNLLSTSEYFIEYNNISIYPNPLNESNELSIKGLTPNDFYNISLYSLDGKKIIDLKKIYSTGLIKIDLQKLQSGKYLINIHNISNNKIFTKAIIK